MAPYKSIQGIHLSPNFFIIKKIVMMETKTEIITAVTWSILYLFKS